MFSRPTLFVGVLVAAVVVPYILFDEHLARGARAGWNGIFGRAEREADKLLTEFSPAAAPHAVNPSESGATIEEAFRFDLTPQWVTSHWRRVSTVLGDPTQLGMRVALVSGTSPSDIAGSLTYYFDEHHQLQRITFSGFTADPRRLLAAVVTPLALKSKTTTNAAHYFSGDPQQPTSQVVVRHPSYTMTRAETARLEVLVDLRRNDALAAHENADRQPDQKILPTGYRRW